MAIRKDYILELQDKAQDVLRQIKRKDVLSHSNGLDYYLEGDNSSSPWESYLVDRGFLAPQQSLLTPTQDEKRQYALQYFSNKLTYPLTISHHWDDLMGQRQDNNKDEQSSKKVPKIVIVGAEMELMVGGFWSELPLLVGQERLDIYLVGPSVTFLHPGSGQVLSSDKEYTVDVEFAGKTVNITLIRDLIENFETEFYDDVDAFVAFVPGCGSPNRHYTWKAAFDVIRKTSRPLLLTAYYREDDVASDSKWWMENCSVINYPPAYNLNPWRSLEETEDPMTPDATNGYSAVVVPKNYVWVC